MTKALTVVVDLPSRLQQFRNGLPGHPYTAAELISKHTLSPTVPRPLVQRSPLARVDHERAEMRGALKVAALVLAANERLEVHRTPQPP